jgi:hypothetical protein
MATQVTDTGQVLSHHLQALGGGEPFDARRVEGEVAYIIWHAKCASADIVFGTDTFIVRYGKIAVQTFAVKIEPR